MDKIRTGDKVAYKDPDSVLGKLFPEGVAEDVIPPGFLLGNGEKNISGQDIIICKPTKGTLLMFLRDELVKI